MRNTDVIYMTQAIRLANLGLYTTRPNPRVGCVLVKNAVVIAEGWHQYAGGPHAERVALTIAGDNARGATAYVSLEPCCHHGRTPPLYRCPNQCRGCPRSSRHARFKSPSRG